MFIGSPYRRLCGPKTQGREYDEYVKKLTLLHKVLVFSMKSKQTIDLSNVEELRSLLDKFHSVYFDKTSYEH